MQELQNRLAGETSPYLQQHAHNPVAWQPWDEQALAAARASNRPILLSIGYSACHWCHVMAHESFEDEETARLMNALYVNIKVDREERPDLDKVYQLAHQVLSQRGGGWPLTVMLAPDDLAPFFAGTYFPREPRYGMPAFRDVLKRVHAAWVEQREQVIAQNRSLQAVMRRLEEPVATHEALSHAPLYAARALMEENFDDEHGGLRGAPKFPHPDMLEFLLNHADAENDTRAREIALLTLRRMANSGLFDQLGGGFYRYCVDARWEIPHFEKMLYDNGSLLALYASAARLDGRFREVTIETAEWLLREMRSPEGAFFSSLDADTNGEEGGTYAWTREEIHAAFEDHAEGELLEHFVVARFGLNGVPNFEGRWHLNIRRGIEALADQFGMAAETVATRLDEARRRLLDVREAREQPGRDEKILVSWNALAIRGLAIASRQLERDDWQQAAEAALQFIRDHQWRDGRLLAVHRDGRSRYEGYLDDYAFLAAAVLELLQCRWKTDDLAFLRELVDAMLANFEDHEHGGLFFTAHDHERLLHRPKPFTDEATPSGNGIAAQVLIRLGHLVDERRYLDAAERCLLAAASSIERAPHAHASLLEALREWLAPGETVILRGEESEMRKWQAALREARRRQVLAIPAEVPGLPEALALRKPQGACVAYVCRGFECSAPAMALDALLKQ